LNEAAEDRFRGVFILLIWVRLPAGAAFCKERR
jgi:hypothetical protein